MDNERRVIELEQRLGPAHARTLAAGKNNGATVFCAHDLSNFSALPRSRVDPRASSEGAPRSSQLLNSRLTWAKRQSSKIVLAIADTAPDVSVASHAAPRCSSHDSKASGSGSSWTALSSNSRLRARPIASAVWSRLRLRRRPSEASSAASKAAQISAGRNIGNADGYIVFS